jgi:hypothetical protein
MHARPPTKQQPVQRFRGEGQDPARRAGSWAPKRVPHQTSPAHVEAVHTSRAPIQPRRTSPRPSAMPHRTVSAVLKRKPRAIATAARGPRNRDERRLPRRADPHRRQEARAIDSNGTGHRIHEPDRARRPRRLSHAVGAGTQGHRGTGEQPPHAQRAGRRERGHPGAPSRPSGRLEPPRPSSGPSPVVSRAPALAAVTRCHGAASAHLAPAAGQGPVRGTGASRSDGRDRDAAHADDTPGRPACWRIA